MIATALEELGAAPGFLVGGSLDDLGVSSRLGRGGLFVVEADTCDRAFLCRNTPGAPIGPMDPERPGRDASAAALEDAFVSVADTAHERVVLSADEPMAQRLASRIGRTPVTTFGESESADVRVGGHQDPRRSRLHHLRRRVACEAPG